MSTQKPPEHEGAGFISREKELFRAVDELLTKAVPYLLGLTMLYLLAHLIFFLR